jgi:hypothetical protein
MASLLSFGATLVLSGMAAGVAPPASLGPQAGAVPRPGTPPAPDPALSEAVTRALEQAAAEGWSALHIETECQNDAGRLDRVEIFGSGVAIWNRQVQFRLSRAQVDDHLEGFRQSGFADWPPSFGGKTPPSIQQEQPPRVICRVVLELDGVTKQVAQFQKGEQSNELKGLARGILDASRERAESGVRAESLSDGLRKIASGALAPEAFQVTVNRRARRGTPASEAESWLLKIDRGETTTLPRTEGKDPGEPLRIELGAEDLARLAGQLEKADLAGLPGNLYADRYTTVLVRVLDHRTQIQARPFAGMTSETHGEAQERFDQALAVLEGLHQRALAGYQPTTRKDPPR